MRLRPLIILFVIALATLVQGGRDISPLDDARGAGELRATIVLDANEPDVDVDPQRGGIITYTGTVVTTQPRDFDFQFGIIELNATCSAGWEMTDIPDMTVTRTRTILNFSVSVKVPPFTISTEQSEIHTIQLSGSWRYEPGLIDGEISPTNAFLHVNQIYQYSLRCEPGYVQTSPGGEFDIELLIENTGNGDDEVDVVIDRRDAMEDNGWAFVMDKTQYEIGHGETVRVPVTISAPKRWDGWRNVISVVRFQVSSSKAIQNNDVSEIVSYSLYIRQRGVSVPGLEAPLVMISVLAAALLMVNRRR